MKTIIKISLVSCIIIFISVNQSVAQEFGNFYEFHFESTDTNRMVRRNHTYNVPDNELERVFKFINHYDNTKISLNPRSPILLGVKLSPDVENYPGPDVEFYRKKYASYRICDSSDAKIIALGITSENLKDFKYHVVENDSLEIIPWSTIPDLEQNHGASQPYANLGTYNSPGNQILVEVVSVNDYSVRDGIIFDWEVNYRPVVNRIVVSTNSNFFNLNNKELNRGYVTQFDSLTGMPIDLSFPLDSVKVLGFFFKNHETIPYKFILTQESNQQKTSVEVEHRFNRNSFYLQSNHFNQPGKYILRIEPTLNRRLIESELLLFNFQVLPPPLKAKTFSFIQVAGWGSGVLLMLALVFSGYYIFNKRKLLKARQQKELTGLKLKSIQSQLNPHFMFNALSSIQNLMNKNDIEGANRYLGKFSGLTRKVLDSSDAEMISLEDELKILEDYIQMEQLRFGFMYEIKTGENINTTNIEVPAMLLQPFVENAVKHGVSALNKDGMIRILASRVQNDIILQVEDNGAGFIAESINGNSKGIKLVKERIALLNQSFGGETLELKINSGENGTTVILKLKNWV